MSACCRLATLLAAALLGPGLLRAQADPRLSYTAAQLDCAQFLESSHTTIATVSGRREREQTAGRRGIWRFLAEPSGGNVALEGWLDTLTLWRRSPESTVRPDTDGLIGGRYRGVLGQSGTYTGRVQPFVPDEVAEVAGMATALDDFFAPLPSRPLHSGEVWTDSSGLRIHRLSDSALSGLPLYRYALEASSEARNVPIGHDSIRLKLHQVSKERGTFVWHPTLGLLKRERVVAVETSVPSGRGVPEPVRSRIEQRITLTRDLRVSARHCPAGKTGSQTGNDASDR